MTGSATAWVDRFAAALREEHRLLFDYERRALKPEFAQYVDCPVCGHAEGRFLFEKDWFVHVRCPRCRVVYMNPRLSNAATVQFYNSAVNAVYNETKFDVVSNAPSLDDEINFSNLDLIVRERGGVAAGELLEIGSATGAFLRRAKERGFSVHGLELIQRNWKRSADLLGPTILNCDVFDAAYPDATFDVLYMRDVIEHIAEPRRFARELARIAKPGCLLFVETHNIDSIVNRLTGKRHTVVFGFEHPVHWSPVSVRRLAADAGFAVTKIAFASLDCTVFNVVDYLLHPSFTTVYPDPLPPALRAALEALGRLVARPRVSRIDRAITPRLANALRRGSVMKVVAVKRDSLGNTLLPI